jgi:hypothetical protein
MGQQQLLLIILGVIIVAIAIAVGLNLFSANSITVNRDAIVNDINMIASDAQQHYLRPVAMGGGGGTFNGYQLPQRLGSNGNGRYQVSGSGNQLEVFGESVLHNNVSITLTLTLNQDGWYYVWDWDHEGL